MSTDPLERVERVRPDDVDEALIWIIGERHHQRVREEMAAYLNDKMAMRALAAHSAAPIEREILSQPTDLKIRMFLWLGHGHQGQYGDDGEMQCGECARFGVIDYLREPLEKVVETARLASLDSGLRSLSQEREPTNAEDEAERVATNVIYHIDQMYPAMWDGVPKIARTSVRNTIFNQVRAALRPGQAHSRR